MSEYTTVQIGSSLIVRLASFVEPSNVPEVSMRQAKRALLAAGKFGAVESAIAGLSEPDKSIAQIEWSSTGTVRRDHPMVAFIGGAAGLSEAEIDALFAAAALIE